MALLPAKDALHPAIKVNIDCEMFSRFELPKYIYGNFYECFTFEASPEAGRTVATDSS